MEKNAGIQCHGRGERQGLHYIVAVRPLHPARVGSPAIVHHAKLAKNIPARLKQSHLKDRPWLVGGGPPNQAGAKLQAAEEAIGIRAPFRCIDLDLDRLDLCRRIGRRCQADDGREEGNRAGQEHDPRLTQDPTMGPEVQCIALPARWCETELARDQKSKIRRFSTNATCAHVQPRLDLEEVLMTMRPISTHASFLASFLAVLAAGLTGCSSTDKVQPGTGGKSGTGGLVTSGGAGGQGGAATGGASSGSGSGGATGTPGSGGTGEGTGGRGGVSVGGTSGGSGITSSGGSGGAMLTGGAISTGGGTGLGGSAGGVTTGRGGATPAGGGTTPGSGGATAASGGATIGGGGTATGSGGATTVGSTGGATSAKGGSTGSGGTTAGGASGTGGSTGTPGAATLVACPDLPGATKSPLYSVTVGGTPLFVEKLTKFSPEMQVHYASGSLSGTGTATVAVTVSESFNSFTISPKSRMLSATKSGNTITFDTGPNYLILQFDSKELLFILLDAEEASPPKVGDANVKSLADYSVDSTGAALVTSKIQSAIDAASGATQNILYVPPGKYKVGELWLKSNMTMYLACGAILYGSSSTSDFNTGSGGINIEGMQHSLIRMYQITNAKLLGRGVLDANGLAIRAAGLNASLLKIDQSSNVTVDGILVRDSSYWNTLSYRSDQVTIQNYKVINCRPNSGYNNTDGVDFCDSTNSTLYNAFLYTGDDGMAPKNEDTNNTKNLTHQHVVVYNNSVGCKIGTNSLGQSMDSIVFKDIDVVKAGRAMTIEAYDTAVVSNATFEDVRVEAADSILINLALDSPPTWRTAADTGVYKDTYFTNVSSDVKKVISMHGESSSVNITGVHFKNLTIQGKTITSQTDSNASWDINSFVSGIAFQ